MVIWSIHEKVTVVDFRSTGEPSQAVSTSSGAEDCRLTRSTDNSPEDHQASENIDLPSSPVEVNYTNGRHTEETSEEEEEMNREHMMADVEGETEIHVMKKRKKTKKLHEVIWAATRIFDSGVQHGNFIIFPKERSGFNACWSPEFS